MKSHFFLFSVFLMLIPWQLGAVNYVIDYAFFSVNGEKPYVEFYLSINGNSISYANTEGELFQAKIEVTYIIEKDEKVVAFDKFQINSPEYQMEDRKLDLIDLKRFPLDSGEYLFSFVVKDLTTGQISESFQKITPGNFDREKIVISDILLANEIKESNEESAFNKGNLEVIPNFAHQFGSDQNQLSFYAEVYNAEDVLGEGEAYLIEYMVVQPNTERVVANLRYLKRQEAEDVSVMVSSFNIENLPSGNHQLVINARDRNNELFYSSRVDFHRINLTLVDYSVQQIENTFVDSITDINRLKEYIKSLRPISTYEETQFSENQLEYADLRFMQRFFLNFWKSRNAEYPEEEWKEYMEKLKLVDERFGYGNIKGYATERGRVYLQYGPPNAVQNVPYEPDAYPYSIWQYYKLQGLTDRKFVFYSPSLEMLGYEILHSNVRGEINNPGWEADLNSASQPNRRSNREDPGNTIINDRARDLFNNPR